MKRQGECPAHQGEGVLAGLDGYMNIAMEQTEEYENGQLRNKYADTFIRGSNGTGFLIRSTFFPDQTSNFSPNSFVY